MLKLTDYGKESPESLESMMEFEEMERELEEKLPGYSVVYMIQEKQFMAIAKTDGINIESTQKLVNVHCVPNFKANVTEVWIEEHRARKLLE